MTDINRRKGVALLLITSALWSFAGISVKLISWNGFAIAGWRGLLAAVVMLLYVKRPRLPKNPYQIAAILSYVGLVLLLVLATKKTTAANAILLQYTAPVYAALLGSAILHEKVKAVDWIMILFMLGGLAVFVLDGIRGGGMTGNILALCSGVCYGSMNVFMKKGDGSSTAADNVFWGSLITFFVSLPFMGRMEINRFNILTILFMGFIQLGLAYLLYSIAVPHVPALQATLITVFEPILNPAWVALLYHEKPSIYAYIGGIIVLGTLVIGSVWKAKAGRNLTENTVM